MATKNIKIYPTPDNNVNEGVQNVRIDWAIQFLSTQLARVPLESRESAMIRNWDKIILGFQRTSTKKEDALDILQGATNGLTQAQVNQLLALLQS